MEATKEIIIIYKSYTPAQARAQKKWYSKPENKARVNEYYKRRFQEGDDEYKELVRSRNREKARRHYHAKKAKEIGCDYIEVDI
jgi:hypothetical protein